MTAIAITPVINIQQEMVRSASRQLYNNIRDDLCEAMNIEPWLAEAHMSMVTITIGAGNDRVKP